MLYRGEGVNVKFSPWICIDLSGVPDQGWGSGPLDSLASAAPDYDVVHETDQDRQNCHSICCADIALHSITRSSAVTKRLQDALCLSVVSFNSTKH